MTLGKTSSLKRGRRFLLLVIMLFMLAVMFSVPSVVIADSYSPEFSRTTFIYNGSDQHIFIKNYQSAQGITWKIHYDDGGNEVEGEGFDINIGSNVCSGTVYVSALFDEESVIEEQTSFSIVKRNITLKPVDVKENFKGQAITPKDVQVVSGSLVNGHNIDKKNINLIGFNNVVGSVDSSIDKSSVKINYAGYSVTNNYNVSTIKGKLTLQKGKGNYGHDPGDEEGALAGPSKANPSNRGNSSNNNGNSNNTNTNTNTNGNTNTNTNSSDSGNSSAKTDSTDDTSLTPAHKNNDTVKEIDNNPVPLGVADTGLDESLMPIAAEANTTAGLAIFFAIFMVIAIISIHLIERWRRKRRTYQ